MNIQIAKQERVQADLDNYTLILERKEAKELLKDMNDTDKAALNSIYELFDSTLSLNDLDNAKNT